MAGLLPYLIDRNILTNSIVSQSQTVGGIA
jgi:hypothetical protein